MFKSSTSEFLEIRGLQYHIRHWGDANLPILFMLHGWMDSSATFQFLIEAMQDQWHIIAPDFRGFGLTQWPVSQQGCGQYWFHDYLADLEVLLDYYSPHETVTLIGHSMGGNIASIYAGVRTQRVNRLVLLDAFGLLDDAPEKAPRRIGKWLDAQKMMPKMGCYASLEEAKRRLQKNDPFLSDARANFLVENWTNFDQIAYRFMADPAHKLTGPLLFRLDEFLAIWRQIQAPVLLIDARQSALRQQFSDLMGEANFQQRFQALSSLQHVSIDQASHMLHHDQPEHVAQLIQSFLTYC